MFVQFVAIVRRGSTMEQLVVMDVKGFLEEVLEKITRTLAGNSYASNYFQSK